MIREVAKGIYRGPRLMPDEYKELVKLGVKTVINLEKDGKEAFSDMGECREHLIQFIWQPMSELLPCSADRLRKMASLVQYCNHPVYIHCRRGIDRTGQVIAAWRIMFMGWEVDAAYDEQVSYGHPELYNLLGWKYVLTQVKEVIDELRLSEE